MFLHPTFVWQNIRVSYQQQGRSPKRKIILLIVMNVMTKVYVFILQGKIRDGIIITYLAY